MTYAIINAETDTYIATTKNRGKDPKKECCFANLVLYKMYDYARRHTILNLTFEQFCDECRAIDRYVVADIQKYSLEQLKDIMRNQTCFPNLYGHFILVPEIE
jgi:hypothetical protein